MKKIFNEYGGVVVAVIAVVAVIGLVSFLMKPGGVIDGAFTTLVQTFVDKSDASLDAAGAGNVGAGGSGGSGEQGGSGSALNPAGTIPAGATYTRYVNGSYNEDECNWSYDEEITCSAGEEFPTTVTAGDMYACEGYVYCYGYAYCESCGNMSHLCGCGIPCAGWSVRAEDNTLEERGPILESINGKPITCMREAFANHYALTSIPTIPNTVTDLYCAFFACDALEGTIEIPCTCEGQYVGYDDVAIKHFAGCGH